MNSEVYMGDIENHLFILQQRIQCRSSLNILNLHVRAEDFYRELLNLVYGYDLVNANVDHRNSASIDLIDEKNKILFQVTSTMTKKKIENTLSKSILQDNYSDYTLYFMFIAGEAKKLRDKQYENPYNIAFDPKNNIFDNYSLVEKINSLDIAYLEKVYELVKKYLQPLDNISQTRVRTLLPTVIQLLCKDDTDMNELTVNDTKTFEISEKININHLEETEYMIQEYAPYEYVMNKIYNELDKSGGLKSKAILTRINKKYRELSKNIDNENKLFSEIINSLVFEMMNEKELVEADISQEELDMCMGIIVVDAFIRCKIFKKPGGAKK